MEQKNSKGSHKTILKATSIFGFTQVLKMLIGVIGSKFIAIFLGPIGIGIAGLLNNTIGIISSITSFGLNTISIREISLAHAENDEKKLSERFIVLQRWSFFIGLFGAIIAILFSQLLSKWTFGTTKYYFWFVILSLNFVFSSLTSNRIAVLQGLRMIKSIAFSNFLSSLLITIITVPIYYFFKFDGIVPVILLSSAIGLFVNLYYTRNIKMQRVKVSFAETISRGKPLMKLGFLLSINVIFGQICTYIIKLYLNGDGTTVEILGLYEVSTVLLLSYVGMIFNAMSTDFYPRLTAIQNDNVKVKELVNDQIEIGLLLITPAITLFYFLAPILIKILYTKAFIGVLLILKAALFAVIIKAIIWPLAFIILAKGENKLYFRQEILGDFLNIVSTIAFYHFFGLIGIGIASAINYLIYGFYVYHILHNRFDFSFRKDTYSVLIISFFIGLASSIIVFFVDYPIAYFPIGFVLLFSIIFSYKELDKRIDISYYYLKLKNKIKKDE